MNWIDWLLILWTRLLKNTSHVTLERARSPGFYTGFELYGNTFLAAVYNNLIVDVLNAATRAEALTAIYANLDGLATAAQQAKDQVSTVLKFKLKLSGQRNGVSLRIAKMWWLRVVHKFVSLSVPFRLVGFHLFLTDDFPESKFLRRFLCMSSTITWFLDWCR